MFVVLLLFVMFITTVSDTSCFFMFSGKCYTGSLPVSSAPPPIRTVRSFDISDLCISFYVKLQTISWIKNTVNIFSKYNQQDATFHNLFISVSRSTCFRRVFRPSSAAENCTSIPSRLAAGSSNGMTNT